MLNRLIRTTALGIPLVLLCACASVTRPPTYGLDAGGAALVRQTCTEVMGLHAAVAEYDACGVSLAESVRLLNDAHLTALANEECEREGFKQGTSDLAKCVVMARRGELRAASAPPAPASAMKVSTGKSYFSVTRAQQEEREELSCAHLGLHPASAGFQQCVATLRNAILTAQNPL
jgi:hypothetical protein